MRITIKVGSNVLTRADGSLDVTRMSALVDQIADLKKRGMEVILVSSGAVASGRSELKNLLYSNDSQKHEPYEGRSLDDVDERQLFSAIGQAKLINRYFELFRDHGIHVGQVLTTKENFINEKLYQNQKNCVRVMLQNGVLPIVNENDAVSITELMFTDNDELSALMTTMMQSDMLIILSNIDGFFDGCPQDENSKLIPVIKADDDISKYIQTEKSSAGRGGMKTKSFIAQKLAKEGVKVILANGNRENVLVDLIDGNPVPHTEFVG